MPGPWLVDPVPVPVVVMCMGEGKRAIGLGVVSKRLLVETAVDLEIADGFLIIGMGIQIEGCVNHGKFGQRDQMQKLFF